MSDGPRGRSERGKEVGLIVIESTEILIVDAPIKVNTDNLVISALKSGYYLYSDIQIKYYLTTIHLFVEFDFQSISKL